MKASFSDQSHSAAHKVPRDGENYAPQFAQHTPLSGADLYPLGNKENRKAVDRQEKPNNCGILTGVAIAETKQ